MAQVIPITEGQDPTLMALALNMARGMENGTRSFQAAIQTDAGQVIFQRLGSGMVRALVSVTEIIVGYNVYPTIGSDALTWNGKNERKLPALDGVYPVAIAYASSKNGSIIVGQSNGFPVKWVNRVISELSTSNFAGAAFCISSDGGTIAGELGGKAALWTADSEVILPTINDAYSSSYYSVRGISGDGEIAVGLRFYNTTYTGDSAVVWSGGTVTQLPNLTGSIDPTQYGFENYALGISKNGKVIVGGSQRIVNTYSPTAVKWVSGKIEALYTAPGHYSVATSCSEDGSIIVGYYFSGFYNFSDFTPCFWVNGELNELKVPDAPTLTHGYAYGVSANGKTIVGAAFGDGGAYAAKWVDGVLFRLGSSNVISYALGISG